MKIQSKKKFIAFIVFVVLLFSTVLVTIENKGAQAATIYTQLTSPEAGWRRYDDGDSRITYTGNWLPVTSNTSVYNSLYRVGDANSNLASSNQRIQFKFKGTKLRLICAGYSVNRSNNIVIKIDGVIERFSQKNTTATVYQALCYEKINLSNTIHTVEIYMDEQTGLDARGYYVYDIDAIDIDSDGYLVTDVSEISLDKTSLSLNVGEIGDLIATVKPDNASIKDITWSSSDEGIATVDENGKVTAIKDGNATITATTADGTNLTATCDVTVIQPSNDRAILAITMTNGQTKEYDLPNSEIEAFASWFDSSNGKGQPKFGFTKKIQLYKEVKEYVVFDKISSYEVRSYTVSN